MADDYSYPLGEDYWGHKIEQTSEGNRLHYKRQAGNVTALLQMAEMDGNGHTTIGVMVIDADNPLVLKNKQFTVPKADSLSTLIQVQRQLDDDHFGL